MIALSSTFVYFEFCACMLVFHKNFFKFLFQNAIFTEVSHQNKHIHSGLRYRSKHALADGTMSSDHNQNAVTKALALPEPRKVIEKFVTLNTGHKFPLIGFGTYTIQSPKLIHDCIDWALAAGYRAFDTAAVYGNEEDIGKSLRHLLPKYNLERSDIFITSKLSPKDHGANKVYNGVMGSLSRLGVTYIDLYLIHWPGASGVPMDSKENKRLRIESWKGLEDLHKSGQLKAIGVSNYTVRHLEELLKFCTVKPAVNQVEFSIHYRQSVDLFKLCDSENIILQSYSSLGGNNNSTTLAVDPVVEKVAHVTKVTPVQVLLRWVLQKGYTIIPKSTHKERVEQNVQLDFELNNVRMNALNNISTRIKYAWNPDTVY
uniref:Putative reductase n=2 Tax=Lygus hesperus TaxID=30085 RepID=A0A0A9Z6H5_LYGHE